MAKNLKDLEQEVSALVGAFGKVRVHLRNFDGAIMEVWGVPSSRNDYYATYGQVELNRAQIRLTTIVDWGVPLYGTMDAIVGKGRTPLVDLAAQPWAVLKEWNGLMALNRDGRDKELGR